MPHPLMFSADDPLLERLRRICLALPGVVEHVSHGRAVFKVKKLFVVYGGGVKVSPGVHEQHEESMLFLPDPAEAPALREDPRVFLPAYYGPSGWLGIDLPDPGAPAAAWDEIAELIETSYRLTAPKRLLRDLDG
ncbi:MmcQ/YjbR family DNA-binding protein [Nocardioides limicola]|uniref:MmcQ/YjbR family DNA-binding protein n=1 Tax=Nocardioides limicola TaxID=2803368 RepID=UPI00193B0FC0|nr:MmcQ/YjbR family DNA-binding protein [Nocardioides sp. DJM-14]